MRRTAAAVLDPSVAVTPSSEFREIPLEEIYPPTAFPNPRTTVDTAALEELAASIRQHGLLQPIVVQPAGQRRPPS